MTDQTQPTAAALDARLAALEAKIATFEQDHEPGDAALAAELRARQRTLRDKVSAAIEKGDAWEVVGAELTRDFDALAGEVEKLFLADEDAPGAGPQTGASDARR